jgi:hypothetical protein
MVRTPAIGNMRLASSKELKVNAIAINLKVRRDELCSIV